MYEHRSAPLLPRRAFNRRMLRHGLYALALLSFSLIVGTWGFVTLAGQEPIDALLDTAMLLGGMGPVGTIQHTSGKLFATVFALYAGLVFLSVGAILLAPVAHRLLHKFHLADSQRHRQSS
jgi:hypothetical protein